MTLSDKMAKLVYETAFESYFHCPYEELPPAQKWRYIRVANRILDLLNIPDTDIPTTAKEGAHA